MSSPGPSAAKKRARYTTRACNGCRRRRCKCDGVQPTCGTCTFYGHECSWDPEADVTRPPTKQLIASLRIKIQVLEAEIRDLQTRPIKSEDAQPSHSPDGFLAVSGAKLPTPNEFRSMYDAPTPHPPGQWVQDQLQMTAGIGSNLATESSIDSAYQYIFNIDTSIPPEQHAGNVQQSLACDWARHLPDLDGIVLTRLEHDKILYRCFQYSTCWLLTLIPRLFLSDMLHSLSQNPLRAPSFSFAHYSASLHNSLLAFACAYSDEPSIKQRATREKFAQRANLLLKEEFHRPSLNLVQSLAMISEYHCSFGEMARGYMYMGMSVRALCATGLNRSQLLQNAPSPPGSHERDPEMLRNWNFWSIFSQDKLLALECSRPFGLPSRRANAPPPRLGSDRAYHDSPQLTLTSDVHSNNQLTQTFSRTCELMQIAEEIVVAITQDSPKHSRSTLSNIQRKLDNWLNSLPSELQITEDPNSPSSHVIALNICYWWMILLAHRPFHSPSGDSTPTLGDISSSQYYHAARKIVELVTLYTQWHPPYFFPRNLVQAIFAAGQAFLHESVHLPKNAGEARASALGGARNCIGALYIASNSWDYARQLAVQLETLSQPHM